MRGASAIQDILAARPDLRVRVLVVWEPVIATDLGPPTTATLARLHDPRVAQYWDHDRVVSSEIIRCVAPAPERYGLTDRIDASSIVWDTVAVFPSERLWEQEFPVPTFYGFPVVAEAEGLAAALESAMVKENPKSSP